MVHRNNFERKRVIIHGERALHWTSTEQAMRTNQMLKYTIKYSNACQSAMKRAQVETVQAKLNHKLWPNTEKPIKHHNFIPFFRFDRMHFTHSTNHLQLISRTFGMQCNEPSERSEVMRKYQ